MEHFGISEGEILELPRPIYSMTDAGDYWRVTVDIHVKNDLGLIRIRRDPSLYTKRNDEEVDRWLGMCADDGCPARNEKNKTLQGKHWTNLSLDRGNGTNLISSAHVS